MRYALLILLTLPLPAHAFADGGVSDAIGGFVVDAMQGTSTSPDNPSVGDSDDDDE